MSFTSETTVHTSIMGQFNPLSCTIDMEVGWSVFREGAVMLGHAVKELCFNLVMFSFFKTHDTELTEPALTNFSYDLLI